METDYSLIQQAQESAGNYGAANVEKMNIYQNEDMVKFIKEIHNDTRLTEMMNREKAKKEELTDDLFKSFYGFLGNDLLLSFPAEHKDFYFWKFQSAKNNFLIAIPEYKKNNMIRQNVNNIEAAFFSKLLRAVGTKENRNNERILTSSQINQTISTHSEGQLKPRPSGMLGGIKRAVGL